MTGARACPPRWPAVLDDWKDIYEEALFREKESAQITLQSIGDGVVTTNAASVIDYINPVAEQLSGWRGADARGAF